jgi:hypothetical protein
MQAAADLSKTPKNDRNDCRAVFQFGATKLAQSDARDFARKRSLAAIPIA